MCGQQPTTGPSDIIPPIFFRRYAGIPDFLTAEDMDAMVSDSRIDPKMVFSYVQEVYRMCNEM